MITVTSSTEIEGDKILALTVQYFSLFTATCTHYKIVFLTHTQFYIDDSYMHVCACNNYS